MSLSDLFFELSNETRVDILNLLHKEQKRLTDISKELDVPVQEVSRQLSRLEKISIVKRDSDGFYGITAYAENILALIPGFDFLYNHRDYFIDHTMVDLPTSFIRRIGELRPCSYENDIMIILDRLEETLGGAEKYIHIMLDQIVSHTLPILEKKVKSGVEFHFITTKNINPPSGIWNRFNVKPSDLSDSNLLDTRFIDTVPLGLVLTDREVGLISFKTMRNEIDYRGFNCKDELAHVWASDVFDYYWAIASNVWPEELIQRHKTN